MAQRFFISPSAGLPIENARPPPPTCHLFRVHVSCPTPASISKAFFKPYFLWSNMPAEEDLCLYFLLFDNNARRPLPFIYASYRDRLQNKGLPFLVCSFAGDFSHAYYLPLRKVSICYSTARALNHQLNPDPFCSLSHTASPKVTPSQKLGCRTWWIWNYKRFEQNAKQATVLSGITRVLDCWSIKETYHDRDFQLQMDGRTKGCSFNPLWKFSSWRKLHDRVSFDEMILMIILIWSKR